MEAAFRSFPGVPTRLEKIRGSSWLASWYNDSKPPTTTPAEVALPPPCPVRWWLLAGCGQVKQGDPQAVVEGSIARPAVVLLMGEPAKRLLALWPPAVYGGEVHCLGGPQRGRAEAGRLCRSGDYRTLLLSPACCQLDQYATSKPAGNHFRSLVTALEPDGPWLIGDEEQSRRFMHRPSGAKKAATLLGRHPQFDQARNFIAQHGGG